MLLFLTVKNWFCKVSLVCLGVNWFRWPCDFVYMCACINLPFLKLSTHITWISILA